MTDTTDTTPGTPGNDPSAYSDGTGLDPRTPPALSSGDSTSDRYLVASGNGATLLNQAKLLCILQMPLPGVVIFVHGVNSEGEWFEASEEGLCAGLNSRLGRLDDHLVHTGKAAGQMASMKYTKSLTDDGFINPRLWSRSYLQPTEDTFSPVIHFRWGYKANKDELKRYGDKIFLNEQDYWGGGPFANGCGSLPDLWNLGVDPRIFGFLNVQGINPTNRPIFETPPRSYNVMAALRLAKLIQSIRKAQPDVPVTVVCHSQGNMVGMAAAFLGDRLSKDAGVRCVADTYVLANPPYSLLGTTKGDGSPGMEVWTDRNDKDSHGNRGRVGNTARVDTLKKFFALIAQGKDREDQRDALDFRMTMANHQPGPDNQPLYDPDGDRASYGVQNHTYGRVTLYSNPHDQVISAAPVQGMGWRGLRPEEVALVKGTSLFTQRVFASGWTVGTKEPVTYYTWENDWRYGKGSTKLFFYPTSPPARFDLVKNLRGNEHWVAKILSVSLAPILYVVTMTTSSLGVARANGEPPKGWNVLCDAPGLPETFTPKAIRLGKPIEEVRDGTATSDFNEENDPAAAYRNKDKSGTNSDDPYDNFRPSTKDTKLQDDMKAQGDVDSEAGQRYEDHAIARMEARHDNNSNWVQDGVVVGEAGPGAQMPDGYKEWRDKQIVNILDSAINNPTNHSTIMTNSMHAKMALAYDVAIGISRLSETQLNDFRIEADWRFGKGLSADNPNRIYFEYFKDGTMHGDSLQIWINKDPEATLPSEIDDKREGGKILVVGEVV
ncbi:T6SS effector phospholipase Tle3 domain-containing protein [Burkholderia alba]|uniref:T6SS effector phospholipase Tle3 domain-containing protein n=1 Tax=Burkholderia alba TaxID=2683677 RepID=UPI002B05E183|nr:hypothetical protein [Burkholderia alba]